MSRTVSDLLSNPVTWTTSVTPGVLRLAGFVISKTEGIANSTYYYGLGVVTVAAAVVLFVVAPWTQRQMADVDAASQNE